MVIRVRLVDENVEWCRTETVEVSSAVKDKDYILAVVKDTAREIALNLFPNGMGEDFGEVKWNDNEVAITLDCHGKRVLLKSNQDGKMIVDKNQSVPDRKFEIDARW